jgi:hypothetical protein
VLQFEYRVLGAQPTTHKARSLDQGVFPHLSRTDIPEHHLIRHCAEACTGCGRPACAEAPSSRRENRCLARGFIRTRKEDEDMRIARRIAIATAVAGLLGAESVVFGDAAQAAPSGRHYVGCGTSYSRCVALRHAYIKDGSRIGPLHFGQPGCTAPPESGCSNENWFYVYS